MSAATEGGNTIQLRRLPDAAAVPHSGSPAPEIRPSRSYIVPFAFLLWLGGVLGFLYFLGGRTDDDAFIFFRYADHIAAGHGYVWNLSDGPVEGITSGLWLGMLTIAAMLGLPLLLVSKIVGIATLGTTLLLLRGLLRRLAPAPSWSGFALIAALLALADPEILLSFTNGMETGLFITLMLALILSALRLADSDGKAGPGSTVALPILSLLACLARPDGAAFAGLALLWVFWQRRCDRAFCRRLALATVLALILPGALYMAWRVHYFGHLLPNPFYVKQTSTLTGMVLFLAGFGRDEILFLVFAVLLMVRRPLFGARPLAAIAGFLAATLLVYARTNDVSLGGGFYRYLAPTVILLRATVLYAIMVCLQNDLSDHNTIRLRPFAWVVIAALFATTYVPAAYRTVVSKDWFRRTMDRLHHDFTRDVANALQGSDAAVLIRDAGQAWHLPGRDVIDLYGLNDPFISQHSWFRNGGTNAAVILDYIYETRRPGVFLLAAWSADGRIGSLVPEVVADARFARDYTWVGARRGPVAPDPVFRAGQVVDGYYMVVALRRDLPNYSVLAQRLVALCDTRDPLLGPVPLKGLGGTQR